MKIMVGYDESNASKDAVKIAMKQAKAFDAEIHIAFSYAKGSQADQVKIKEVEKRLEDVEADVKKNGIKCQSHLLIRGMEAGEDIVDFAREKAVDMIVIGVYRRSKVGKILFGSTAQYIILKSPCPVLTVK